MNEHEMDANVRSSRRQFLHMGAGLAGALSVGSILAACGAGQPALTTTQNQAESGTAASASAITLQAFLVIARYRRPKWNSLTETERDHAEEAAEVLFPEKPIPVSQMQGVLLVRTFNTSIHSKIPYDFRDMSRDKQDKLTQAMFDEFDAAPSKIAGTDEQDPGVGWIAVVDANHFPAFVEQMGGKAGPLWHLYDMEIIPLNNDQTTHDIYELMTPRNWS